MPARVHKEQSWKKSTWNCVSCNNTWWIQVTNIASVCTSKLNSARAMTPAENFFYH